MGKESVKKIKAHWTQCNLMEQSSMSTAISREPLLCRITPHPLTKQQVLPSYWTLHRSALPISNHQWDTYWYFSCSAIGQLHIGPYLMITVNDWPLGKWFSQETVVHWLSDSCLWATYFYLFIFLIGNVFLVDGASWVSLLNMRVEMSPTILVEKTFISF